MTGAASVPPDVIAHSPLLRTADLGEARTVIGRAFCDHRLALRNGRTLSVTHDQVGGRTMTVNVLSYGAEVEIDPSHLGRFYLMQFPIAGRARIAHRGEEVIAGHGRGTILTPDRDARMVWGPGCRKILVQIDRDHLDHVASELIGDDLPGPVRFAPAIETARPGGARLYRRVLGALSAAGQGTLWSGRIGPREIKVERDIAVDLLMSQPSNVSHMLWRRPQAPVSRDMRLALDYLHAHLADPVAMDEVARHAGVTLRTLQLGFARSFGRSPKAYLRDLRLDAARYRLSRRSTDEPVTAVALECGFTHLGRFARAYADRFGHRPSERGR